MEYTRLGRTGLSVSRTSFGALPIQRIPESESTAILRAAYEAGINFYDTANAYTDSEFKLGQALGDVRRNIIIATKTAPAAPEVMQQHLEQSLKMLRTDYIDIYQLHCAPRVYRPARRTASTIGCSKRKRRVPSTIFLSPPTASASRRKPWKAASTIPCNIPSRSLPMSGSCAWPSAPGSWISASSP